MTSLKTTLTIAAATLLVAAGTAGAQTLKAEIPFPFRAGNAVLAPGTYLVSWIYRPSGQTVFRMATDGGRRAILLVPQVSFDSGPDAAGPVLTFQCGVSRCALSGLSAGPGTPRFRMPLPRLKHDDPVHVALIEMHAGRAD